MPSQLGNSLSFRHFFFIYIFSSVFVSCCHRFMWKSFFRCSLHIYGCRVVHNTFHIGLSSIYDLHVFGFSLTSHSFLSVSVCAMMQPLIIRIWLPCIRNIWQKTRQTTFKWNNFYAWNFSKWKFKILIYL